MSPEEKKQGREVLYTALAAFVESHQQEKKAQVRRHYVYMALLSIIALSFMVALYEQYLGTTPRKDYVALVRMQGEIGSSKGLSSARYAEPLTKAFHDERAKGVVLVINSPGGEAAQSQLIHDQVVRLSKETGKRVIVVGEDKVTSGAYMIAAGAEKIFAPTTAMIGSIGVVSAGFDISELAARLGIKDRTLTAGGFKDPLNPLKAVTPEAEAKIAAMLKDVHQEFIRIVQEGRGDRLKPGELDLFTGEAWSGKRAEALGLIDGHLDLYGAAKQEFGVEAVRPYTPKGGAFDLSGLLSSILG